MQLLKDASEGRLEVHPADALEFDIAESCGAHVQKKNWHEGDCARGRREGGRERERGGEGGGRTVGVASAEYFMPGL